MNINFELYRIFYVVATVGNITKAIIDRVYEDVEQCMGTRPNSITVVVTGIISKNIAKRNIEVRR